MFFDLIIRIYSNYFVAIPATIISFIFSLVACMECYIYCNKKFRFYNDGIYFVLTISIISIGSITCGLIGFILTPIIILASPIFCCYFIILNKEPYSVK